LRETAPTIRRNGTRIEILISGSSGILKYIIIPTPNNTGIHKNRESLSFIRSSGIFWIILFLLCEGNVAVNPLYRLRGRVREGARALSKANT
jgi:hypothetical protein